MDLRGGLDLQVVSRELGRKVKDFYQKRCLVLEFVVSVLLKGVVLYAVLELRGV